MVKKLIEGFLKLRGGKNGERKGPADSVPDELPALGEESAASAAPQGSGGAEEAEGAEPPDELPSLEGKNPEAVEFRHIVRPAPQREEPVSLRREVEEAPDAAGEEAVKGSGLGKDDEQGEKDKGKGIQAASDGFFAGISKMLKDGKPFDSILSHDLLANMKESWGIRKESSRTGLSSTEEKRVTAAISEVLSHLRLMESKWKSQKMILDEYERLAKEQEEKIKEKEKELKVLLKKYKIYQPVPDNRVMMLKGSIPIRSVSDMVNALRTMDTPTFNAYVNSSRNDFSRLAACIDKKLGNELGKATTKDSMLKALDVYVRKLGESHAS